VAALPVSIRRKGKRDGQRRCGVVRSSQPDRTGSEKPCRTASKRNPSSQGLPNEPERPPRPTDPTRAAGLQTLRTNEPESRAQNPNEPEPHTARPVQRFGAPCRNGALSTNQGPSQNLNGPEPAATKGTRDAQQALRLEPVRTDEPTAARAERTRAVRTLRTNPGLWRIRTNPSRAEAPREMKPAAHERTRRV
jgi:hypothetical protein